MKLGIISSSSRRECFHRPGGSHSAAAPTAEPFVATSAASPARKWCRVIAANMRGRRFARRAASGNIHIMMGSS